MKNLKPLCLVVAFFCCHLLFANIYYVSTTGNDTSGDGSAANPWKSLKYAVTKVAASQGHVIQVGAGTFMESGLVEVPLGVSILGVGKDITIFKAASSFYYHPADPGYATDKFLISLSEYNPSNGNQSLKNFTVDGDGKQLHGGIYVRYRNNVTIDGVKVQNTNFTGIWIWDVKDSKVINTQLINCSWGSAGYCAGALNLGNLERVEIAQLDVNENTGYGIKAIGPNGYDNIFQLKIHHSRVSVNPFGLWNNGSAPNIAIELWQVNLVGCELYNTYVDNTISLVNSQAIPSTGIQTIRVHDNIIDMEARANGQGYGLELTIHDAEVDHNYFNKGNYGIANWDNPMKNWSIHHNIFYAIQGIYPGEVVRSQWSGLHNVKLYNNTIEFASDKTMNVIGLYGGISDNLDLKNNLVINSNTSYNYYRNQLIHMEGGATVNGLQILNNSTAGIDTGLSLIAPSQVISAFTNPSITKVLPRPQPYYVPATGSSLINAGINVGYTYVGSAPDIGAYETGIVVVPPPDVTPPVVVVPPAPAPTSVKIFLAAATARLTGKMILTTDPLTAKSYFSVPAGNGSNYYIPPPAAAVFSFQIPNSTTYVIWAKVRTPANQSCFIYDGRGTWFTWKAGIHPQFTWVKITNSSSTTGAAAIFTFIQGLNQIQLAWNDDNVQVEQILITDNFSFVPQ